MDRRSSTVDWVILVMLTLAYSLLSRTNTLWDLIESINANALLICGLLGVPFIFGFISYFFLGRYLSRPFVFISATPLLSSTGTAIYIAITFHGPRDELGLAPYLLKFIEASGVFLGAVLAFVLRKKGIRARPLT
jgi:hypothetical protein